MAENHLLRAVQASINFDFIYDEVKDLYSETAGRPSIDPVVLIPATKRPEYAVKSQWKTGLPVIPYKRLMTKEGYFKKYEYVYDEYYCICPNNQVLKYSTTNKDGYREYKSNPLICTSCSMRPRCTQTAKTPQKW